MLPALPPLLGVCLLTVLGAGCGWPFWAQLEPPSSDSPGPDADLAGSEFRFAEDDDPLVAALPFVQDELLARVMPGAQPDDLQEAYDEAGVVPLATFDAIGAVALGVETDSFGTAAGALARHPAIESVHKSYLYDAQDLPNDPELARQTHVDMIGLPDAWNVTTGDEAVIIAIVDTGVDGDHPDLRDKLIDGWNVYANNRNTEDVLGHGTAVAGTAAAATDNRLGVAGVAWGSSIMPVRVANRRGQASSRDIAGGIIWATDRGARVINVSFAPLGSDATVLAAARYARNSGCLVCISTGNSGQFYQARSTGQALFVGAVDETGQLASFSDYGAFVNLVAPGSRILTTAMDGGYRWASGTSFASPVVAGVAALVWSVNPNLRPVTVESLLFDHAIDLGQPGPDEFHGHGMIDAAAAVEAALLAVEEVDIRAPDVEIVDPDRATVVSGYVRISVNAFDRMGLADVVLSVDGHPYATDTAKPFRFTLNGRKLPAGWHTLTVVATDLSGNASAPDSVRVFVTDSRAGDGSEAGDGTGGTPAGVDEPEDATDPVVTILAPADGSRVVASVAILVEVADDTGLRTIDWLVDGFRRQSASLSGTRETVRFIWEAGSAATGVHRVTVRVQDAARNESSGSVTLVKE